MGTVFATETSVKIIYNDKDITQKGTIYNKYGAIVPLQDTLKQIGFTSTLDKEKNKLTVTIEKGKTAEFTNGSATIKATSGDIKMKAKVYKAKDGKLYGQLEYALKAVGFKIISNNLDTSKQRVITIGRVQNEEPPKKEENQVEEKQPKEEPSENNGVMKNGVRKAVIGETDLSQNEYLKKFMSSNYAEDTYYIAEAGVMYSPFGMRGTTTTGNATIYTAVSSNGYWYICVRNFDAGKERPVMQAMLKVLTSDYNAVYSKFVEMWDNSTTCEEAAKKYDFGKWKKAGKTTYMFDLSPSGGDIYLKIKY